MNATQARGRDGALLRNSEMFVALPGAVPIMSWPISRGLRNDVGDSAHSAFLDGYVRMWPHRYSRLTAAIKDRDREQAMNIARSIRSSSHMLGALRVSRLASAMEQALRKRRFQAAGDLLHELESCGDTTVRQLSASVHLTTRTLRVDPAPS